MKERPILFSAPMVRALLEGRKTQTRRVMKPQPDDAPDINMWAWFSRKAGQCVGKPVALAFCPYGVPGDRLWVRETWGFDSTVRADFKPVLGRHDLSGRDLLEATVYRADIPAVSEADERRVRRAVKSVVAPWRPSIYMPRWASRITLEVTEVRVQRLKDISEEDARAEGVERGCPPSCGPVVGCDPGAKHGHRDSFCSLWGSINGPASWATNPWIWAITFKRVPPAGTPGEGGE